MQPKRILNFAKNIDNFETVDLNDKEVKKIINDETLNIYNIFSSLYHTTLDNQDINVDNNFSNSLKYSEAKLTNTCLYCAREHEDKNCPFVICKKCGEIGHLNKFCTNSFTLKKSTLCKKCKFSTHSEFDCPAIYRRYKFVRDVKKTCGNCAGDHFCNDCTTSLDISKFSIFSEKYYNFIKKYSRKR
ncbi:hypothetical protein AAJ76_100016514 [Vairimorpha ceranae]|uniref:CCHC-type domain-containing protein n=1 Tax=Vairimorpha ceranae TaxID=40302 RepID=A0A0F9YW18_9MICR|nr:hypothetical protein AAJ76_100016514 [Vairimorpha ceranae]KAF5141633.1 hypothetical protein G9O61_00g001750 [Vairimorpha ceranae]KKO76617.1 hypothetical protein AAJ76_100016514 [Vairimorpha ceranae]